MFLPFREGGKLGTFNYKQINPFAKYGFIPRELVTPLRLPHRLDPRNLLAAFGSPFIALRGSVTHGREGGDARVNAEILNVYISPSDRGVTGMFARDRELEICSLSPGRNYTRG